jgi:hypothetical protein
LKPVVAARALTVESVATASAPMVLASAFFMAVIVRLGFYFAGSITGLWIVGEAS